MIAFSSDRLFHSWAQILGPAFVRKYQADKIGGAVEDVYFDGQSYHRKQKDVWVSWAKQDFVKWLCSEQHLDSGKARGKTSSETTDAEVFVQLNRRVDGLVPRLFDRRDVIEDAGKTYLNCSRVKPIQPAEEPQTCCKNFRWLSRFFELRFDEHERKVLFAWWKRFYQSALQGDLLKGQALFIVGKIALGKTLLGHKIIGASVGGAKDASAYVTKNSEFNKELIERALWTIDDGEVASNLDAHKRFSALVKRLVANPVMDYRAMYRDAMNATWNGRLLVTLNDDSNSLEMIPDLETSMEEKVLVLHFLDTPYEFPPKHKLENTIAAELPFFLRWLVDWEVPTGIAGDNRLGVRSYINEELREKALHSGDGGSLLDVIAMWIKRSDAYKMPGLIDGCWEGTAAQWFGLVASDDFMRPLVTRFTTRSIGKRFNQAARIKGSGIEVLPSTRHGSGRVYRISVSEKIEREASPYEVKAV